MGRAGRALFRRTLQFGGSGSFWRRLKGVRESLWPARGHSLETYQHISTGGAGFIGSHLVDGLVAAGHRVRILDSLAPEVHLGPRAGAFEPRCGVIHGDVSDAATTAKALDGIDVVYHLAAEVGLGRSMYQIVRFVQGNDMGTAVLLEEMIKRPSQFKKLIVASSMSLYGEGPYSAAGCGEVSTPTLRADDNWRKANGNFPANRAGTARNASGRPKRKLFSRPPFTR